MEQVIEQISTMQQLMAGQCSLSPQQQVVAALHSLNTQHNLQCLDEKDENLEFPEKWRDHPDGSYSFRYRNLARGTVAKFKLTVEDKYVVVIFGEEGSKESFRVTINSTEPLEAIVKQYTFTLKQYLGKDSFSGPSMESKPMPMPVSQPDVRRGTAMVGNQMLQPVYPPKNLINSGSMQNPFGQEEYVGPNSSLFSKPEYQQPQGSLMIPPGARYDPVDPFDSPLMERREEPNDFVMGFDEFGAPIKRPKPRGVMPPGNPFQGGFGGGGPRGGFGGGLGGGFSGGFGGLV